MISLHYPIIPKWHITPGQGWVPLLVNYKLSQKLTKAFLFLSMILEQGLKGWLRKTLIIVINVTCN